MNIPMVINFENMTYITDVITRDGIIKEINSIKPKPYRLTMLQVENNCQFCENPKGGVYTHMINFETHFGFASCIDCYDIAKNAVIEWIETESFGSFSKSGSMPSNKLTVVSPVFGL